MEFDKNHQYAMLIRIIKYGFILFAIGGCKKLVSVPEPISTITTTEVFNTDAQANSAMAAVYTNMINDNKYLFSDGFTSIVTGLSSDELIDFYGSSDGDFWLFNTNALLNNTGSVSNIFWTPLYSDIYQANSIIQGISASTSGLLHDSVRNELTGEAKFVRAFCYFYLTNLFGDVPLALTIDFNQTGQMTRTPQPQVYNQIVRDLMDAQGVLASDNSVGLGERIRPNKWAATALLARVYLYLKDWADAETQSTLVINNSSLFSLVNDPNKVFLKNSTEAIWQLQQNTAVPTYTATQEGAFLLPSPLNTGNPNCYLTTRLLQAFETGDLRRLSWIDSTIYNGDTFYFPYKYKTGYDNLVPSGNATEYYTVLRLAEQFLIRAEARVEKGESADGTRDLNIIRSRAALPEISATSQSDLLLAIYHERQVELFVEWGHRWFDLKRTALANNVLSAINMKQPWSINSLLYPIPASEIIADHNLTQNVGYGAGVSIPSKISY